MLAIDPMNPDTDKVLAEVESARDEIVAFAADLIRIPTLNPPGDAYHDASHFIGDRLTKLDFEVDYPTASDHPDHSKDFPRVNVVGRRQGASARPLVHLNGHIDVVPTGSGWSVDPFGGLVEDGKLLGRGSCDVKAGIAAAVYAAEAVRRAGVSLAGSVELSGTVDEETGGFAGVRFLCEQGRIARDVTDYVIIPESLNVDRICVGHREVYWFKVTAHGRIAHGSMPFLGESAIDRMSEFLEAIKNELVPELAQRVTATPVVPPGARHATLNINSISGGQAGQMLQSPCVADRCEAIFDRRFLQEEGFDKAKEEVKALLERVARGGGVSSSRSSWWCTPFKRHRTHPSSARSEPQSKLFSASRRSGSRARAPTTTSTSPWLLVSSTASLTGRESWGSLTRWTSTASSTDLVNATKVLALTIVDLVGEPR